MKIDKQDIFSYTLGITLTFELLLKKPQEAIAIYIHSKFSKANSQNKLFELIEKNHIEVIYSDKIFNILSQKENCFIIGKFKKFYNKLDENNNHIVLVNPSNAGNLGTIIRSVVGFGISNIAIIKPGVDIFDTKCIRASMGSIFSLNFTYYDSFEDYQKAFKNHTLYPFMLKAKSSLSETNFIEPCSLIFGNEATGLPDEFLELPHSVIIKHSHNIDSLNLTIAASIACYELTKKHF